MHLIADQTQTNYGGKLKIYITQLTKLKTTIEKKLKMYTRLLTNLQQHNYGRKTQDVHQIVDQALLTKQAWRENPRHTPDC